MKYKCTNKYEYYGITITNPGDIIVLEETGFRNITTGKSYTEVPIDMIKMGTIAITDEETKAIYTDVDRFSNIAEYMTDLFKRKNHDYGNSFEESLNEEGLAASRIRIGDKWNRFKNLSKYKNQIDIKVFDESLRDTLIDMANYAIMTVMWLDKTGKES